MLDGALDVDRAFGEQGRPHLQRRRRGQAGNADLVFVTAAHRAEVVTQRGLSGRGEVDDKLAGLSDEGVRVTPRSHGNRQARRLGGAGGVTEATRAWRPLMR